MPGSFVFPETSYFDEEAKNQVIPYIYDLMYHSYVTLSTLGYGDITKAQLLGLCVLQKRSFWTNISCCNCC